MTIISPSDRDGQTASDAFETPWLPASAGPERWRTVNPQRTVVAVTRNETTTATLLQVLPDVLADTRVQIVFTVAPDRSAFGHELELSLSRRGLPFVEWAALDRLHADLIIAASYSGVPTPYTGAPVLYIPHGYGNTKSGLQSSASAVHAGDTANPVHAVPHPSVAAFVPRVGRIVVVGDVLFDSLAEAFTHRGETRLQLGAPSTARLVCVSSTWGPESLLASWPRLIETLVGQLPSDEYVVAGILHPNIWAGHGRWQTQTWLRPALRDGLRLVPFECGWQPVLAAADIVIGDHGSVTFYADLLGKPVARVMGSLHELATGTVLTRQVLDSPRLSRSLALRAQLDQLTPPTRGELAALRAASVAYPGQALARLRRLVYELLELGEPATTVYLTPPSLPDLTWSEPLAYWVRLLPAPSGGFCLERLPWTGASLEGPGVSVARLGHGPTWLANQATALLAGSAAVARPSTTQTADSIWDRFPLCRAMLLWTDSHFTVEQRTGGVSVYAVEGADPDDPVVQSSAVALLLTRTGSAAVDAPADGQAVQFRAGGTSASWWLRRVR